MDNENLAEQLRSLPPDMPNEPGRFASVRQRAQRTRQRHVAGAVLGGAAALAIALPVAQQLWPETATPAVPADNTQNTEDSAQNTEFPWPDGVEQGDMPGLAIDTAYTDPVTMTHTGTATVDLGPRPPETEEIVFSVECLSPGQVTLPYGITACTNDESAAALSAGTENYIPLDPEQDSLVIKAPEETRYRITTRYAISDVTDWKMNANGQTYGLKNRNGTPDLVPVTTSKDEAGWAYADDIEEVGGFQTGPPKNAKSTPGPTLKKDTTVPVYKSDGSTLIGKLQPQPEEAPRLLPTS